MCFDGSGGHAPPVPRLRFPDSAERLRAIYLVPASGLGQRGIAPLGSELTCDMASARSAGDRRSNWRPRPFGSSFPSSTWLRSRALFWSLRRGFQ